MKTLSLALALTYLISFNVFSQVSDNSGGPGNLLEMNTVVSTCKPVSGIWSNFGAQIELKQMNPDDVQWGDAEGLRGLDLFQKFRVSVKNGTDLKELVPKDGLSSATMIITPASFLKPRLFKIALKSEGDNGLIEIKDEVVKKKEFAAKMTIVSKTGSINVVDLSCTNNLNY